MMAGARFCECVPSGNQAHGQTCGTCNQQFYDPRADAHDATLEQTADRLYWTVDTPPAPPLLSTVH